MQHSADIAKRCVSVWFGVWVRLGPAFSCRLLGGFSVISDLREHYSTYRARVMLPLSTKADVGRARILQLLLSPEIWPTASRQRHSVYCQHILRYTVLRA